MIGVTAAIAAIGVAQEFDKRQLMLEAVPGTPLAKLNECFAFTTTSVVGTTSYDPSEKQIYDQSNNWGDSSGSIHTTTEQALAEDIAVHVQSHLNFAKNTVRPLIEELVLEVKADIEALPLNAQYSAEVIISDLPEPMTISSFEDTIMDYKNVEYLPINTYLSLPGLSATEIVERMLTGHSVTDKAITTWVAKKGDSFFQHIWDCVFTNAPTEQRFESLIKDNDEGVDAAIAVYLLASKLYDNPIDGTKQSLNTFNKQVAEIRNQAALRLVHAYDEYVRFKTTGLLIKSAVNNKIVVVGDAYRKWMEEGGNNAVLFGSMLSSSPEKFVTDINNKKGDFLAAWERQNWMLTVAEKNKRFVHYKDILKNRCLKLVADNYAQCFAHLREGGVVDSNMPEYLQFQKNLEDFLITLNENDFKNLWKLAQDTICRCVFYYTDAGKILSGIEKACADNVDIHVREAALISTIAYVTDYVCDQMKLTSI